MDIRVCFDVGGTEIKVAAFCKDKTLVKDSIKQYPSYAQESCEYLMNYFAQLCADCVKQIEEQSIISEIAFAFPGPFDYEKGISYIRGIDKYESLYRKPFRELFLKSLGEKLGKECIENTHVWFVNDVSAFAYGYLYGRYGIEKSDTNRWMFICIGTGCGSAFAIGSELVKEEVMGVPQDGYVYSMRFMDGVVDDYVSKRGLVAITEAMYGRKIEGLELSKLMKQGEKTAKTCFDAFGNQVYQALLPFVKEFQPHYLVIGGQVVKSGNYFLQPVEQYCKEHDIQMITETETSICAMNGMLCRTDYLRKKIQ